jgi:hypothetical protein
VDAKLRAGLERLAEDGLREKSGMTLTPKGRKRASDALGIVGETKATWPRLKAALVELALGRSTRGGKPLNPSAIRALALASKLGLNTASTRPAEVLDAWAARELGMPGTRFSLANVRAHLLSRALGIELRDPKRVGAVAVARVLDVPRTDAGVVRDAVLRDWLADPKVTSENGRQPDSGEDLEAFASSVREIARATDDGRFGRHKVFIAPIWNRVRTRSVFRSMNEDEFKAKLVDAHRAGLLRLSRADLTPAMARDVVEASEVSYLNAVFHFVDLEGTLS